MSADTKPKRVPRQMMTRRVGCLWLGVICIMFTATSVLLQRAGVIPNSATYTARAIIAGDVTRAPTNIPNATNTDEPTSTDSPSATITDTPLPAPTDVNYMVTQAMFSVQTYEANAAGLRVAYAEVDGVTRVDRAAASIDSDGSVSVEAHIGGSQSSFPDLLAVTQETFPALEQLTIEIRSDDQWIAYQWEDRQGLYRVIDIANGGFITVTP